MVLSIHRNCTRVCLLVPSLSQWETLPPLCSPTPAASVASQQSRAGVHQCQKEKKLKDWEGKVRVLAKMDASGCGCGCAAAGVELLTGRTGPQEL